VPLPSPSTLPPDGGADESLNLLLKYDVIIIDEAHERTLNTDFLLGSLKKIQRIRKVLAKSSQGVNGKGKSKEGGTGKGKGKEEVEVKELKIVIMSATLDPAKFERFFNG
jgi:HrpA-like RNA helicase